jgi:hypothetical protein
VGNVYVLDADKAYQDVWLAAWRSRYANIEVSSELGDNGPSATRVEIWVPQKSLGGPGHYMG